MILEGIRKEVVELSCESTLQANPVRLATCWKFKTKACGEGRKGGGFWGQKNVKPQRMPFSQLVIDSREVATTRADPRWMKSEEAEGLKLWPHAKTDRDAWRKCDSNKRILGRKGVLFNCWVLFLSKCSIVFPWTWVKASQQSYWKRMDLWLCLSSIIQRTVCEAEQGHYLHMKNWATAFF